MHMHMEHLVNSWVSLTQLLTGHSICMRTKCIHSVSRFIHSFSCLLGPRPFMGNVFSDYGSFCSDIWVGFVLWMVVGSSMWCSLKGFFVAGSWSIVVVICWWSLPNFGSIFHFILILQPPSPRIGNACLLFCMISLHSVFPPAFASWLGLSALWSVEVFCYIVSMGKDGILEWFQKDPQAPWANISGKLLSAPTALN